MASKKYYWLKFKRDFFKRHDIRIIKAMPNGKEYVLFYLELMLESIDHEGNLRFSDTIPYNEQMLSVITDTNIDIVRSAIKVFTELNMIEILDDQTLYIKEVEKLIGSETASAERVREYRNRQKALQCNADVTKCNIEKETEENKEKDKEFHSFNRDGESKKLELMGGKLGQGVVFLSEEQESDLLNKLSLDEYNKYVGIVAECELSGKKFKNKTHYQAILDMVAQDRKIKN